MRTLHLPGFFTQWLCALLAASAFLPHLHAAENAPRTNAGTVNYNAFVNWDFRHRKKLTSWKTTALVIERTLELWYGDRHPLPSLHENGTPEMLRQFLETLPDDKQCAMSVVYLASHQSPQHQWDFTQRRIIPLDQFIGESKVPPHRVRIVILDACYAAGMNDTPQWREKFPGPVLFAALASEPTPDLNFRADNKVDLAHLYPAAYAWLKQTMGRKWDGKISYLGLVWVQAFLETKTPPTNASEWSAFFRKCSATSVEMRKELQGLMTSEIITPGK